MKFRHLITFYTCAFCLFMTVACKKPATSSPPEITNYYLSLGSQFRYLRTIGSGGTIQNDTVTLVAESLYQQFALNGYKCGVYLNGVREDSGYFLVNEVSVEYDPLSNHPLFLGFLMALPMYNNQSWGQSGDSTHVSYWGDYQGIDSVYHNVYKQYYVYTSPGAGCTATLYFSPSAGLVYESYMGNTITPTNETITYTLLN